MNRTGQASLLILLIAAALSPRQLAAQLTPIGPETRVDTNYDYVATCPQIGVAPDRSFEIAWSWGLETPTDVKVRHYNASGLPTDRFEVPVTRVYLEAPPPPRRSTCGSSTPPGSQTLLKRSSRCRARWTPSSPWASTTLGGSSFCGRGITPFLRVSSPISKRGSSVRTVRWRGRSSVRSHRRGGTTTPRSAVTSPGRETPG
jgi:hypothetical protein